jgi:hypothetical protein
MAEIKIRGDVSGSTTIKAPDSGSDEIIELSSALASKVNYPSGGANGNALIKDGTSAVWGAVAAGKILQIVRATDTTTRSTTSTSFVDASISVTITPQKNNSAIIVVLAAEMQLSGAVGTYGGYQITDASNNALSGAEELRVGLRPDGGDLLDIMIIFGYSTPATTNATTYKARFRRNFGSGTVWLMGANTTTQLYAIEVGA